MISIVYHLPAKIYVELNNNSNIRTPTYRSKSWLSIGIEDKIIKYLWNSFLFSSNTKSAESFSPKITQKKNLVYYISTKYNLRMKKYKRNAIKIYPSMTFFCTPAL